jgi:hypothetical protein
MDEDRQIRFLIPPFFLYVSLAWWAYINPDIHCWLSNLMGATFKESLPILAAVGAATIPVGYSIGTVGILLLRWSAYGIWIFRKTWRNPLPTDRQTYEACLSGVCFSKLLFLTAAPDNPQDASRPSLLYAAATFDHELLPKGIHEWLRRRFNAFMVAFNSALSIIVSFLIIWIRHFFERPFDRMCGLSEPQWQLQMAWPLFGRKFWWLTIEILLVVFLLFAAYYAWHETMGMIEFQARRTNAWALSKRPPNSAK